MTFDDLIVGEYYEDDRDRIWECRRGVSRYGAEGDKYLYCLNGAWEAYRCDRYWYCFPPNIGKIEVSINLDSFNIVESTKEIW